MPAGHSGVDEIGHTEGSLACVHAGDDQTTNFKIRLSLFIQIRLLRALDQVVIIWVCEGQWRIVELVWTDGGGGHCVQ